MEVFIIADSTRGSLSLGRYWVARI